MWLWWPKDMSSVLWRKVITVIQAAEKLVHSSVSASSSSSTQHCSILSSTWVMSSGLWQGAVNEVYNSYLETSRGVAGFSGWSHQCCCHWAEDCTCWNICTTTKLPQSWVRVSVWLTGGSDGGAHAAADSHLPWWQSSSGQSLQMTWVGFRLSLNQEPCRLSAGTLLFILTFLKSQDNRSFWNGAYMHNIFLVNRSQKLHWACTNLQNAENLYWRVFEKFQIKSL